MCVFSRSFHAKKCIKKLLRTENVRKSFSLEGIQYWKVTSDYNIWKLSIENMRKRKKTEHKFSISTLYEKGTFKICPRNYVPLVNSERGWRRGGSPTPPSCCTTVCLQVAEIKFSWFLNVSICSQETIHYVFFNFFKFFKFPFEMQKMWEGKKSSVAPINNISDTTTY